jgi:hypothetical protein
MRVCVLKATGKLIEAQSNDAAEYGTLIANAVTAGYSEEDVEEKIVTEAEFKELLKES